MTFLHSGYTSNINLSATEMLEISQEISRDFTPCFSSRMSKRVEKIKFSTKELFDISEEIGRDFAPKISSTIPELMLLPVDPGHIHAYWHLEQNHDVATPDNPAPHPLTLRIYAQPEEKMPTSQAPSWFDLTLDQFETQQHISLPNPVNATAYSAAIGQAGPDQNFIVFARSNTVHAPSAGVIWYPTTENPIYCLSKNASGQSAYSAA